MPAAKVMTAANSVTRQSSESVMPSGSVPGGSKAGAERRATAPSASPVVPPTVASNRLSVSSCRKQLSPAGTERRSNGKLPRAAHAAGQQQIRHVRTRHQQDESYDARQHQRCRLEIAADQRLCRGSIVTPQPLLVDGEMRAMPAAIEAISAAGPLDGDAGFNRPSTCR